jgi:hypothetical protein
MTLQYHGQNTCKTGEMTRTAKNAKEKGENENGQMKVITD